MPNRACQSSCHRTTGATMAPAFATAPKTSTTTSAARSARRPQPADARSRAIQPQFAARRRHQQPHVVLWTRPHACQAERAVEVASLGRLQQIERAARQFAASVQTIFRLAGHADARLAHADFQRREERVDKVELSDRANVFAKRAVAKQAIDRERRHEVADRQPCGPCRPVPQGKNFVGPQEQRQQADVSHLPESHAGQR